MKRKLPATTEPVIAPEILEEAKRSLEAERQQPMERPVVQDVLGRPLVGAGLAGAAEAEEAEVTHRTGL